MITVPQALQIADQHLVAGRINAAELLARQILATEPKNPHAVAVLGVAASAVDRYEDAARYFQQAIGLSPTPDAELYYKLGETYRQLVRLEEGIATIRQALAINPNHVNAHLSLALCLMTLGRYEEGLPEFQWRWDSDKLNTQRLAFTQPQWDGSDPACKTILLWAEQGLGDVINFARYVPLLAKRGAKVAVGCQPPLVRLLRTLPDVFAVTSELDQTPPFDLHLPTFTLPYIFKTTVPTIPDNVPYVSADPTLAAQWKERLANDTAKLKVGLVWAGGSHNPTDKRRSLPITALAPLAGLKDVSFYSLQTGDAAAQVSVAASGLKLKPLSQSLKDFAETAAVLANLDLLITVDTAIAHLAGAMGRPVWTLLAFVSDWRWMLNRLDTPWYPTMRLFRQKNRGDWNQVIRDVVTALGEFTPGPSRD